MIYKFSYKYIIIMHVYAFFPLGIEGGMKDVIVLISDHYLSVYFSDFLKQIIILRSFNSVFSELRGHWNQSIIISLDWLNSFGIYFRTNSSLVHWCVNRQV